MKTLVRLSVLISAFSLQPSAFPQTRSALMVTNETGQLAGPTNFFAANSNLLNQAVNTNGLGGGGGAAFAGNPHWFFTNGAGQIDLQLSLSNLLNALQMGSVNLTNWSALATNVLQTEIAAASNNIIAASQKTNNALTVLGSGNGAALSGMDLADNITAAGPAGFYGGTNALLKLMTNVQSVDTLAVWPSGGNVGQLKNATVFNPGFGYTSIPNVTIVDPDGGGSAGAVTCNGIDAFGRITGLTIVSVGTGYDGNTYLTNDPPPATPAQVIWGPLAVNGVLTLPSLGSGAVTAIVFSNGNQFLAAYKGHGSNDSFYAPALTNASNYGAAAFIGGAYFGGAVAITNTSLQIASLPTSQEKVDIWSASPTDLASHLITWGINPFGFTSANPYGVNVNAGFQVTSYDAISAAYLDYNITNLNGNGIIRDDWNGPTWNLIAQTAPGNTLVTLPTSTNWSMSIYGGTPTTGKGSTLYGSNTCYFDVLNDGSGIESVVTADHAFFHILTNGGFSAITNPSISPGQYMRLCYGGSNGVAILNLANTYALTSGTGGSTNGLAGTNGPYLWNPTMTNASETNTTITAQNQSNALVLNGSLLVKNQPTNLASVNGSRFFAGAGAKRWLMWQAADVATFSLVNATGPGSQSGYVATTASNSCAIKTYTSGTANSGLDAATSHDVVGTNLPGFHVVAGLTNVTSDRCWIGLCSASTLKAVAALTSQQIIAFEYDSNTNGDWWFRTGNGATYTYTDTGIAAVTNAENAVYTTFDMSSDSSGNYYGWINGTCVATNSMTGCTSGMVPIYTIYDYAGQVKEICVKVFYAEQGW